MYSDIISASDYIQIMGQHVYMNQADQIVADTALYWMRKLAVLPKVLDIGCGPGRITRLLADATPIWLAGIDIDPVFLEHARESMPKTRFVHADLTGYIHPEQVDVVISHGLDHHIDGSYLSNVYRYLKPGGVYVVGDEFLPHYEYAHMRKIKAVIWYSHVISNALGCSNTYLAEEEAKTLLDDLAFGDSMQAKSQSQIDLVLSSVLAIHRKSQEHQWGAVEDLASTLLNQLAGLNRFEPNADTLLSRGDYKVCHAEFARKIQQYGFVITGIETIGPIHTIGGFGVYVLQRPKN